MRVSINDLEMLGTGMTGCDYMKSSTSHLKSEFESIRSPNSVDMLWSGLEKTLHS